MTIEHIGAGRTRAAGPGRSEDVDRPDRKEGAPKAVRATRGDQVEISVAGRVLAASAAGLGSDVIEEVRERVATGFYDSPEIAEIVAQRLIDSGVIG